MKDLLRTADLNPASLTAVLALAAEFKTDPAAARSLLDGRTVVLYFAKPSTRTRISTETAVVRLGGVPLTVGANDLQLGRGETVEDTARVLSSYASAVVIRSYDDGELARFAGASDVPVINALTDGHHPLQSITDLLTMREEFGEDLAGRKLAYVGDGNNVVHSLLEACALAGVDMSVATPPGYAPDPDIVAEAEKLASSTGVRLQVTTDPVEAVRGASAIYTDVWLSMGDDPATRAARLAALRPYQVTDDLFAHAADDAIFLHCLPAHRDEEVTAAVIDGPRSRVFPQAANRLPVAQAVLHHLVRETTAAGDREPS